MNFWRDSIKAQAIMQSLAKLNKVVDEWLDLEKELSYISEVISMEFEQDETSMKKEIPLEEIYKELQDKMSETEIEESINKLIQSNELYHPKRGYIGMF